MTCTPTTRMFAVLLGLSACNQLEKIDESGNASGGDSIPTDVQLAFERSCGTSPACHAAGGLPPTLEGAGIGGLIGAPSSAGIPHITLGDTANSYIAIKMLPDEVLGGLGVMRMGARMPLGFNYDSANDRLVSIRYLAAEDGVGHRQGVYAYDPDANAWAEPLPLPPPVAGLGRTASSAFYDPELNAYFCHFASDSRDDGTMWVYRYQKAR